MKIEKIGRIDVEVRHGIEGLGKAMITIGRVIIANVMRISELPLAYNVAGHLT
jgi:hypothetical protein